MVLSVKITTKHIPIITNTSINLIYFYPPLKKMAAATSTPKFSKNEYKHYSREHPTRIYSTPEEEHVKYASLHSKKCSKCDGVKQLNHFNGNTAGRDGFDKDGYRLRRPECTMCTKKAAVGKNIARKIAKKSGINYKAPLGTACKICKTTKGTLVFDHCHTKEIFRGYLCDPCNRSLGVLGDDVPGLLKCLNYLLEKDTKKIYQDAITGLLEICDDSSTP